MGPKTRWVGYSRREILLRFNLNNRILSRARLSVNQLPEDVDLRELGVMNSRSVESTYDGPVRESSILVAGRSIKLIQPVEPDRLLDHPGVIAWNQAEDYMPYWAYLWPGSLLLGE